jgi:hypothetical protein
MPLPSSRQLANSLGVVTRTKPGATLEGAVRAASSRRHEIAGAEKERNEPDHAARVRVVRLNRLRPVPSGAILRSREHKCSAGLLRCGSHLMLFWGCKSGVAMMSMVGP